MPSRPDRRLPAERLGFLDGCRRDPCGVKLGLPPVLALDVNGTRRLLLGSIDELASAAWCPEDSYRSDGRRDRRYEGVPRRDTGKCCSADAPSVETDAIREVTRQGVESLKHRQGRIVKIGIVLEHQDSACVTRSNDSKCTKMACSAGPFTRVEVSEKRSEQAILAACAGILSSSVTTRDAVERQGKAMQPSSDGVEPVD